MRLNINKKNLIIILTAIVLIELVLLYITKGKPGLTDNTPSQSGKLQITTSFYPLYYFTTEIAGEKAEVTNITPAGAEPHDYELTPRDILRIDSSKLLILSGTGLEPWNDKIYQIIDRSKTTIVPVGAALDDRKSAGASVPTVDPHLWLAPALAADMTDRIAAGLIQVDPANRQYYQIRTTELKNRLLTLDDQYKQGLSKCQRRDFVTAHEAFGYLALAYGLKQVPIAGLSPLAEPSAQQLTTLAQYVKTNNVKYIFFESLTSPKLAQTLATETGAQTLVLNPLEGLTTTEIAQGQTYFTEMQTNLNNLETALQCNK